MTSYLVKQLIFDRDWLSFLIVDEASDNDDDNDDDSNEDSDVYSSGDESYDNGGINDESSNDHHHADNGAVSNCNENPNTFNSIQSDDKNHGTPMRRDRSIIQNSPKKSSAEEKHEVDCPICLLQFTDQLIGQPENCRHLFCLDCIKEWSKVCVLLYFWCSLNGISTAEITNK